MRIAQQNLGTQDNSWFSHVGVLGAFAQAQQQLGEIWVDPDTRPGLAAAQLRLIFSRLQRGIPPGRESLKNLIGLVAEVPTEAPEVAA